MCRASRPTRRRLLRPGDPGPARRIEQRPRGDRLAVRVQLPECQPACGLRDEPPLTRLRDDARCAASRQANPANDVVPATRSHRPPPVGHEADLVRDHVTRRVGSDDAPRDRGPAAAGPAHEHRGRRAAVRGGRCRARTGPRRSQSDHPCTARGVDRPPADALGVACAAVRAEPPACRPPGRWAQSGRPGPATPRPDEGRRPRRRHRDAAVPADASSPTSTCCRSTTGR